MTDVMHWGRGWLGCGLTAALLFGLAACGYTDSGSGTKTLEVQATASYRAGVDANPNTSVDITIDRAGNAVNDANVTLTDGDTSQSFTINRSGNGHYQGSIAGYHRRLALKVQSGSDGLTGKLEGPGRFIISTPQNGATVSLHSDLHVEWTTNDGIKADEVRIELQGAGAFDSTESDDPGSFTIPQTNLQPGSGDVRVTRRNRVVLAGGAGASNLTIEYRVRNNILVQ